MKATATLRIILLSVCFLVVTNGHAQTTNYKVHAVFVYNIAKYSQWPAHDQKEFVITVFGKSKIYDELVAGAEHHMVGGVKIKVQEASDLTQIGNSNIIVVADSKSSILTDILKTTDGKPIMVITEREGLHKKGAGISFFINDQGKLNFDLNLTELTKRKLSMSKSLTNLAASVL